MKTPKEYHEESYSTKSKKVTFENSGVDNLQDGKVRKTYKAKFVIDMKKRKAIRTILGQMDHEV